MLTTGRIYADFDRLITRVEAWVAGQNLRIAGCEDAHVRARVVQRIIEIAIDDYVLLSTSRPDNTQPGAPEVIECGDLGICTESGRVQITRRQWLASVSLFAALWLRMLAFLVAAVFCKAPRSSSAAALLLDAGGGYEESDARLVRFCRSGLIEPLASANKVIVGAAKPPLNQTSPHLVYALRPLLYLVNSLLGKWDRISLLFSHMKAPFHYLKAIAACPLSVLVGRDMSLIPVVQFLSRNRLIESIVATTSSAFSQPIWMKGLTGQTFKLHMVWYSQNFIPKMYAGDEARPDFPAARHMRVDVHWVWTEGFRDYLRGLGLAGDIRVVGPILWYLPEEKTPRPRDSCLKVAVFDVTPLPDGEMAFGAAKNYYSVTTITKFIIDIVDACEEGAIPSGRELLILVKHKRAPRVGRHDSTYLEFLEQIAKERPNFRLIDHHTNLFELLEECDLSVSVPYTSTAYVAASLGKPTIYYDPFAELIPQFEESKFVYFASGPEELKKLTRQLLSAS